MLRQIFLAALALVAPALPVDAATIRARSGASAQVSAAAAGPLQCVVNGLEAAGYPVRFMGGWRARGSVRGSLHPMGMALDVNQVARNRTVPPMPAGEIAIARACGAISGAQWAHRDSGHFQVGGWEGSARRKLRGGVRR